MDFRVDNIVCFGFFFGVVCCFGVSFWNIDGPKKEPKTPERSLLPRLMRFLQPCTIFFLGGVFSLKPLQEDLTGGYSKGGRERDAGRGGVRCLKSLSPPSFPI